MSWQDSDSKGRRLHSSGPASSSAQYFADKKRDVQRCLGCHQDMPASSHAYCYCCELGIDDCLLKGPSLKVAFEIFEREGPAKARGARMDRINGC